MAAISEVRKPAPRAAWLAGLILLAHCTPDPPKKRGLVGDSKRSRTTTTDGSSDPGRAAPAGNPAAVRGMFGYPDNQKEVSYPHAVLWELRPTAMLLVLSRDPGGCEKIEPNVDLQASAERLTVLISEQWAGGKTVPKWKVKGARVYPQSFEPDTLKTTFPTIDSTKALTGTLAFDYHGKEDASFKLSGRYVAKGCGKAPSKAKPSRPIEGLSLTVDGVAIPIFGARIDGDMVEISTDPLECDTSGSATTLTIAQIRDAIYVDGDRLAQQVSASGTMMTKLSATDPTKPSAEIDWDATTADGLHIKAKGLIAAIGCSYGKPAAPPAPAPGAPTEPSSAPSASAMPSAPPKPSR